jgi:DUF4097 and DUF4098 domain-containing protein YvlB
MTRKILLFTFALVVAGCTYWYQAESTEPRSWSSFGVTRIAVESKNGAIAYAADEDTVISADITRRCWGTEQRDAEAHLSDIKVTDEIVGGELRLKTQFPDLNRRGYSAEFDVAGPAGTELNLKTSNGAVSVTGLAAPAGVVTTNGAIRMTRTRGRLELQTTNGGVTIRDHQGTVIASSTNGGFDCDVAALADGDTLELSSTNGGITVRVPADVSASFDLRTTNGEIDVSGFGSVSYTENDKTHKQGTIGSGAVTIVITTTNGGVGVLAR